MTRGLKKRQRKRVSSIEKRLKEINKRIAIAEKSQPVEASFLKTVWKTHSSFILGVWIMSLLVLLLISGERAGMTGLVVSETDIVDPTVVYSLAYNPLVDVIVEANSQGTELAEQIADTMIRRSDSYGTSEMYDYDSVETFGKLNIITAKITQNGLEKLKLNPLVKTISYDKMFMIMLQDSVPIIGADRVIEKGIESGTNSICLIDTGADLDHPELAETLTGGYDFVNNDSSPQDDHNHGTHLAGIIHRIAPRTKIVPVKVCNADGGCRASDILKGINYCFENQNLYNITIVSGSLGDGGEYSEDSCPSYFGDSFAILESVNISAVFASGNSGYRNGINYPACVREVIGVGATDKQDTIAAFSNIGTALDTLAPGVNINSTIIDGYGILSGTSMSTPHVSAALSLLKSVNSTLNTLAIRSLLANTSVWISGYPRINLEAAIDTVIPTGANSTNAANTTNSTNTTNASDTTICSRATEDLTLVNGSTSCFDIVVSNIILDCNNNLINNTNEEQGYAVLINESVRNITVKNCRFKGFKTALVISNTEKILLKELEESSCNITNATISVENKNGIISFSEPITVDTDNLTNDINIRENIVIINPAKGLELGKAAEISFKNITLEYPYEFYDENSEFRLCPIERCMRISYSSGIYTFSTTYTTTYKIDEISQCLDVIRDINLTKDLKTQESCFRTGKDNITINCLGYNIRGENRTGNGVDVTNTNGITIKNCRINNFNEALVFENSTDIHLINNTITDIKSKLVVDDKRKLYLEDNTLNLAFEIENNLNLTLKGYFQNMTLKRIEDENRSLGIEYQAPISLERALRLDNTVFLYNTSIRVDSDSYPELNKAARLSFVNKLIAETGNMTARYDPLDNGTFIECPNMRCTDLHKDGFKLSYLVPEFTTYSFGEKITTNETNTTNTTTPADNMPDNTTATPDTPASNATNTTPNTTNPSATDGAATNIAQPGYASTPTGPVPQPATPTAESPELEDFKTLLEAFEKKELREASEREMNSETGEEKELEAGTSTPSGYLLSGGSTFINNLDILIITTIAITMVAAATYYRFYRRMDWLKRE